MEDLSELEQFLHAQSATGKQEGEGSFTLAREKALMKLAGYQLPFDGAWAVKVFQAAVAAGADKEIRVTLGRRVVVFHFDSAQQWELDEVEEAFFNPEPSTVRHVKNLVSGLWAVGVGEKRAFQLRLEGAEESLVWNGETCQRRPLKQSQKGVELVVTHAQGKSIADWLSDTVEAGRRNSMLASALKDRCFTSPLPLLVDGQRYDALQHCPDYGWNSSSFPIALSFAEAELPSVRWPSGTFLPHKEFENSELMDGAGLETVTKKIMKAVKPVESSALAALVSVHAVLESTAGSDSSAVKFWALRHRSSKALWIQDGAAVEFQNFEVPTNSCSLVCFLKADGLENDLTGFFLADGEERKRRMALAGVSLMESVEALTDVSGRELREHNQDRYSKLGNATLILGVGIGHFVTWGIGALLVTFGLFARFAERAEEKRLMKDLIIDLDLFKQSWKARFGSHKSEAVGQ